MHKKRKYSLFMLSISAILTILIAVSINDLGQERKGRANGVVINTINEPIEGAKIQLKHKEQGTEREALDLYAEGVKLANENRIEEALEAFYKAIELKPDFHEAYLNFGILSYHLQKSNEAEEALLKAHELNPEEPKMNQLLAEIYYESARKSVESKESGEALEKLKQAYSFDSGHAYVNYFLGVLYAEKGIREETIKHLEAFLRLQSDFPYAEKVKEILKNQKK